MDWWWMLFIWSLYRFWIIFVWYIWCRFSIVVISLVWCLIWFLKMNRNCSFHMIWLWNFIDFWWYSSWSFYFLFLNYFKLILKLLSLELLPIMCLDIFLILKVLFWCKYLIVRKCIKHTENKYFGMRNIRSIKLNITVQENSISNKSLSYWIEGNESKAAYFSILSNQILIDIHLMLILLSFDIYEVFTLSDNILKLFILHGR